MSSVIAALVVFCASCGESSQADAAVKNWLEEEREAATPLTAAEQQFRANMLLADVKRVVYRDETGTDIPYDTFAAARTAFKTGRTPEAGLKDLQEWLASLGVQG